MPRYSSKHRSDTGIKVFRAAARLSSFTRAALELGVSPATVGRQIRALEKKLGGQLFVRRLRRVELTSKGRELSLIVSASAEAVSFSCTVHHTRASS